MIFKVKTVLNDPCFVRENKKAASFFSDNIKPLTPCNAKSHELRNNKTLTVAALKKSNVPSKQIALLMNIPASAVTQLYASRLRWEQTYLPRFRLACGASAKTSRSWKQDVENMLIAFDRVL